MELSMLNKHFKSNQKGFTLLETMSVLVIMGVLFSVAIKKFDLISDSASMTAIKAGVRERNSQKSLGWIQLHQNGLKAVFQIPIAAIE